MTSSSPIARLRRLQATLRAFGEDGASQAIGRYIASEGSTTLDQEFGVAPTGAAPPWWVTDRKDRRDAAIRELARFYPTAKDIRMQMQRYAATAWGVDKTLDQAPKSYTGTPRFWLYQVCRLSGDRGAPLNLGHLRRILRDDPGGYPERRASGPHSESKLECGHHECGLEAGRRRPFPRRTQDV